MIDAGESAATFGSNVASISNVRRTREVLGNYHRQRTIRQFAAVRGLMNAEGLTMISAEYDSGGETLGESKLSSIGRDDPSHNNCRASRDSGPRVSVVMPVYNGMPYLPLALDSILGQSFSDFELIVVDDASTDATPEILASYAHTDQRIRVLRNPENRGISAVLNLGLNAARGELIARMDADDISLPSRFQRQVEFLDAHPDHVVVGANCSVIDKSGRVTNRDFNRREVENWELEWIAHFWTALVHPSAMFRSELVREKGLYYDERFTRAEDMDFFARALNEGKGFVLREPLLRYRIHAGNVTSRFFTKQKRECCEIGLNHLLARYPELELRAERVKSLVGMLHRQGLAAGQQLMPLVDTMILLESRFLRRHSLSRRQRRRIQCLTACWIVWGVLQAGRLRPSREMVRVLWRARIYWIQFGRECLTAEGASFALDCIKRLPLAWLQRQEMPGLPVWSPWRRHKPIAPSTQPQQSDGNIG